MPSYSNKKRLRFVITMDRARFGKSQEANQIELEGYRSSADIDKAGGMMMGMLNAKIFGVRKQDMDTITTLQWQPSNVGGDVYIQNTVEVFAIDGDMNTLVFSGNIVNAWADYSGMPDVFLHIQAQAAFFNQLKSVAPESWKGAVDVATAMKKLADKMGYAFESHGVQVTVDNPYLPDTAMEQAKALAKMAGCVLFVDDKTLVLLPPNSGRLGAIVKISPQSGLVGYPSFDMAGVVFQTLFNPNLRFLAQFELITDQDRAAGIWVATSIAHRLESERPNGAWFSSVRGNFKGLPYVGK